MEEGEGRGKEEGGRRQERKLPQGPATANRSR